MAQTRPIYLEPPHPATAQEWGALVNMRPVIGLGA